MSFFERFVNLENGQGPNSLFASYLNVDDLGSLSVACQDSKRFVEVIVQFNAQFQQDYGICKFTHTISKDLILLLRNRTIQKDYKTHLRPIISDIYKTLTKSQIDAIHAFYKKKGSFVELYASMNTKFGELRSSTHRLRIPQSSGAKKHEMERNNSPPPEIALIDEIFKTQFPDAGLPRVEMHSLILRIIHEHSATHSASLRYFNHHPQTFTILYQLMQKIEDACREKLRFIEQEHKQPDTPTLSQRPDSPHGDEEEHYVHLLPHPIRHRSGSISDGSQSRTPLHFSSAPLQQPDRLVVD
ncbi:MAG TPA: hypothetical protein VLG76_07670 [Rhabdochlamydiaceae bacterium]|nr:hypothetical protein [Rhabdochlamydiaceae bacterium]